MVDSDYGTQNKLTTGSTVTVAKTSFTVVLPGKSRKAISGSGGHWRRSLGRLESTTM
ncbi:MAG TPA: hypothetical protein VGI74_11440 [Streptosporangiaceae bacterium]